MLYKSRYENQKRRWFSNAPFNNTSLNFWPYTVCMDYRPSIHYYSSKYKSKGQISNHNQSKILAYFFTIWIDTNYFEMFAYLRRYLKTKIWIKSLLFQLKVSKFRKQIMVQKLLPKMNLAHLSGRLLLQG